MNKNEFISAVALEAGVTKEKAAKCFEAMVATIAESMKKGEEVALAGFGKFEVKERPAREGVNPATGEKIQIAASKTVGFKAAKAMKEQL